MCLEAYKASSFLVMLLLWFSEYSPGCLSGRFEITCSMPRAEPALNVLNVIHVAMPSVTPMLHLVFPQPQ